MQITHHEVSKLKTKHDEARRGEHPLWKMMLLYEDSNDSKKRNAERKSKDKSPLSETLKPINSPGLSTIDCVVSFFFFSSWKINKTLKNETTIYCVAHLHNLKGFLTVARETGGIK